MLNIKKTAIILGLTIFNASAFAMTFTGSFSGGSGPTATSGTVSGTGISANGPFNVAATITSCQGKGCSFIKNAHVSGMTSANIVQSAAVNALFGTQALSCANNICTAQSAQGTVSLHFVA